MNTRTVIALIGTLVIIFIVVTVLGIYGEKAPISTVATSTPATTTTPSLTNIRSFKDCVAAGYPIAESNPRQCLTPDGRTYAEEIQQQPNYTAATRDMIFVSNPYPGAVVGKTFKITGEARGNWYFEASFPVEVRGKNNEVLAQLPAQAQGDWMTTNFVPFSVDITVPQSYIGPATIILHKDNPSGLPENDAMLSIPITIEY
jgi:hypothetical protein